MGLSLYKPFSDWLRARTALPRISNQERFWAPHLLWVKTGNALTERKHFRFALNTGHLRVKEYTP